MANMKISLSKPKGLEKIRLGRSQREYIVIPKLTQTQPSSIQETLSTDVSAPNKIMSATGQQVNKNLITDKQLEQELVRPKKVGGLGRFLDISGAKRFGKEFMEGAGILGGAAGAAGKKLLGIATGGEKGKQIGKKALETLTGYGMDENVIMSPAITKEAVRSTTKGLPTPRQIGSSILTEEDDVSKLTGAGLKPTTKGTLTSEGEIDFTRGSPAEVKAAQEFRERQLARNKGIGLKRGSSPFNILNFEGIENIFSTAGELAAFYASPKYQAQQAKARGKILAGKSRREDIKGIDESIKSLSAALEKASLGEDENLTQELTGQLSEALQQRKNLLTGEGSIGLNANNFSNERDAFLNFEKIFNNPELSKNLTRQIFPG